MAEWKNCKISDIGTVIGGATPSTKKSENYEGGEIPWITPKDLSSFTGRYICRGERNITKAGLKSCSTQLLPKNTVLFSSRAPIGYVAIAQNGVCTNQGFKSVIPNVDTHPLFLYYLLKYNKEKIENMGSGTTFKEVSGNTMKNIEITVPTDFSTQEKIASILGALDDKIEENDRINNNLEQQARLLLTQWISENKTITQFLPLSNVATINDDTYSPREGWRFVNYLDTSSISNGEISEMQHLLLSDDKLPSRARRKVHRNDIVYSTVRPNQRHYGLIYEPVDNMLASTGFAVIRSNISSVSNEILYLCLTQDSFIEKMQQLAEQSTSTFPSIKPSDLGCCEVPVSIDPSLCTVISSIFTSIGNNQIQNKHLIELRNTLLPKLMSGELDVSTIKI